MMRAGDKVSFPHRSFALGIVLAVFNLHKYVYSFIC